MGINASFSSRFGPLVVDLQDADIASLVVDAVVNAANNAFWMGGGVAGALKRAGGEIIEKEAMAQGPRSIGEVVTSQAGRLPARYVIHAAVMGQDLRTSEEYIRRATANTLAEAERLGVSSLGLPAFGTGVGGFPLEACARIMLTEIKRFAPGARTVRKIIFALFGKEALASFAAVLKTLNDTEGSDR